jgi:Helix-turn-helix domain
MSSSYSPGDLLTAVQVQQVLPIGRSSLYRLIDAGHLEVVRIPSVGSRSGRVLILRESLDRFISLNRSGRRRAVVQADSTSSEEIAARVLQGGGKGISA